MAVLRLSLSVALWILIAPEAHGQVVHHLPATDVHGRVDRKTIHLTFRGRAFEVPLDSIVDASGIDSVGILDLAQRGDTLFVLLTMNGPSRGPGGEMGYCGAGSEGYVL